MWEPSRFLLLQVIRSGVNNELLDDTIAVLEGALMITPNVIIVSSYRPRLSHELGGEVDDHDDRAIIEAIYSHIMDFARVNRLPVCIPSMPGIHFTDMR